MLQFRYIIRLLLAFLRRFKGLFLLGIIIGILIFLSFRLISPKIYGGKTSVIGITGRYHIDNLPKNLLDKIGDGLTKVNEKGEIEPNLAKSWETSDKGKTWIFQLDNNIKWQDGKILESSDIKYNFSDVSIEYSDKSTIKFILKDEFSPFPVVVSQNAFRKGLLGTGDWKVEKITLSGGLVQNIRLINSKNETEIYKFYPSEERTKLALKLGQVDIIENIFNPQTFENWKNIEVKNIPDNHKIATVFFNTEDKYFSDKTFRQALNYAINRDKFIGLRAISPIAQDSWAYNPQVKRYYYDQEKAKEMIEEFPKELKDDMKIRLVSTPALLTVAESIVQDWKDVGVDAFVLVSSVVPNDFQAFLAIYDIPDDPDQYYMWHSTQTGTNISKYKSPRIDKLLEDGRSELDLEERRKIYIDFQRFLVEDSPSAFLYNPNFSTIKRK